MKNRILKAWYSVVAFVRNSIAELNDRRLENQRRPWTAYGTFGSGVVPLGVVNMGEAVDKATKVGNVINVDVEQAAIFYTEKN